MLQILYLDSLDVGDIVNKDLEVRAAAWTGQLVSKVCLMDRVSETQFGKLQVRLMHVYFFFLQLSAYVELEPCKYIICGSSKLYMCWIHMYRVIHAKLYNFFTYMYRVIQLSGSNPFLFTHAYFSPFFCIVKAITFMRNDDPTRKDSSIH